MLSSPSFCLSSAHILTRKPMYDSIQFNSAITDVPQEHWFQLLQFRSPENRKVERTTKPWRRRNVQFVRKLDSHALKTIALMRERH
ncbi:hypothetical protein CSKR_109580 [Clonorchis sinensis]|uniref:Uncharacterized protein n=1 Tax=Clonorchis sinensis TaxID=79923 RepID=A0A3R7CKL6_CLOSI|nr:hypothetical protein CSKR_109580 [Clonorchis sinensis]